MRLFTKILVATALAVCWLVAAGDQLEATLQSISALPAGAPESLSSKLQGQLNLNVDFRTLSTAEIGGVVAPLTRALSNPNLWVRRMAANIFASGISSRYDGVNGFRDAQIVFSRETVLSLTEHLQTEPDPVSISLLAAALNHIGLVARSQSIPLLATETPVLLEALLSDPQAPAVNQVFALGVLLENYPDRPATATLMTRFWDSHDDAALRVQLLKQIGISQFQGGNPRYAPLFLKGLRSADHTIRREAIQYGGRLSVNGPIREQLMRMSNDPEETPENRKMALNHLHSGPQ